MQQAAASLNGATAVRGVPAAEPGTVSICFVAAALQAVRARGFDAEALLLRVGLAPSLLGVPQARVSAKHYGALWRLTAATLDDEFFGQDSRRMKVGSFAMLCHALVGCRTLGAALERGLRFFALLLDDVAGVLERDGAVARIVLRPLSSPEAGSHPARPSVFGQETLLMLLHGVACWLVGRRIALTRAEFAYPAPMHAAEYRLMYSPWLAFDRPRTAIAFDATHLDLPVVQNERTVKEFLRGAPENILVKYKNGSSLRALIRKRLRRALPDGVPEFERLAGELKVTPATLRRRLHGEGASYQEIKDQLRRDLAIDYLSHSDRSVMDIALELGFSERSAFYRAFRRWTGASPGEFRRGLAWS